MALFITQCPYCQTSFRTSITQLQSADGMVRCGACLRIFTADDNLLPSAELQTIAMPVPAEDSGQLPLEPSDTSVAVSEPLRAFRGESQSEHQSEHQSDLPLEPQSEPTTEAILTLDLEDSLPNRITPSISENTPFWELLEETVAANAQTAEPDTEPAEQPKTPLPTLRATNIDDDFLGEVLHDVARHHHREHFSAENLAAVHDVATPLEIDWQPPRRNGFSTFMMSLLALLLITALPAQYAWYNRDALSQNPLLRPWLLRACAAFDCTLPALTDMRAIRSEELLVRSHTEIANALTVNLVFRNHAVFAQPFPALELRFTDADNNVIAQRLFQPHEYLTADLKSMEMMPAGAPVQITLEILDPGVSAINYEISFSPALATDQP
ncbi:MAG: zinc-ribbon and DUF3426 domain-containing protein [Pseudomonadota bacterium]